MTLIERQLDEVWNALRAQAVERHSSLDEVRIRNIRGIRDLRVTFRYPVCVLAGPNGCGKSTVLLACACAYRVSGRHRDFVPTTLFPNFTGGGTDLQDTPGDTEIELHYLDKGSRVSMMWRRGRGWNRSYMGRKGGKQPERELYLRTLTNLTNPSEVRGFLQLARKELQTEQLTEDLLIFAQRILPRRYRSLSRIAAQARDLLFAELEGPREARYSEFHMSAGERAILRISKDISKLHDALILIDEIEAGLHPYTQQQAMLELQRIALRNKLQVIVASHSPVVLESVPAEARLFLDRDEDTAEVRIVPPYRDILQKALYGQSRDRLSILCEDDMAEGLLLGFMDALNVKLGLRHDDFIIGRDTGQSEFPGHVRTLSKFGKMSEFLLVLDGDSRHMKAKIESAAAEYGQAAQPLFLPGDGPPEAWVWQALESRSDDYAPLLGLTPQDMEQRMRGVTQMLEGSVDTRGNGNKAAMSYLAEDTNRTAPEVARIVGKREAERPGGEASAFLVQLEERINAWRQQR